MVFSTIVFLFRFLPLAFILYFATPKKHKNLTLLIISLFFYSFGEPKYFPIMIASIIVDFFVGKFIEKNRDNKRRAFSFLLVSLVFNLGMLFLFKYSNLMINSINTLLGLTLKSMNTTLPLGISFYTFQTLSYSIDVYRGKVKAEENIIDFGAFVALFPQLIAGPIVKYSDINKEIKNRTSSFENIEEGIYLFILGLGRKVLIANNLGMLWDEVHILGFQNISSPLAFLGILAFSLQIYYDFSGYSLMAMGLGKSLGFIFPKNFNYPYISRSISEFWRRWHITLGSWFKEYVYIPLGGSRVNKKRLILNLFIVWALTGLWHGAEYNFILWGLYFFILILLEKLVLSKILENHKVLSHIYTLIALLIGWSIFAITDITELKQFIIKVFSMEYGIDYLYYLSSYGLTFLIAIIFSIPYIPKMYSKHIKPNKYIHAIIMMSIFILSVAYLVSSSYNPFLYFRF